MDQLFLTSSPLYSHRGIYLDLSRVPLEAERLLDVIDVLRKLRLNAVFLYWGGYFPWSFEDRVRSCHSYPEEVVSGFYRRLEAVEIEVYTRLPGPRCFSSILRLKSFAYLRYMKRSVDILDIRVPGARQLVQEMVDDILYLCPNTGFFIETRGIQVNDASSPWFAMEKDWLEARGAFFLDLVNRVVEGNRRVVVQTHRDDAFGEGLFERNNVETAAGIHCGEKEPPPVESKRTDWGLLPLSCDLSGATLPYEKVLLVSDRYSGEYVDSIYPDFLHFIVNCVIYASYLWNGSVLDVGGEERLYASKVFPAVDRVLGPLKEFETSIDDIYRLTGGLKDYYSYLRYDGHVYDSGGREAKALMQEANRAMEKARSCVPSCMEASRSFILRGWMEQWCNRKVISAVEELDCIKQRLKIFIDVQAGMQ